MNQLKIKKHCRGQITVFAVLIFQALFICLAMVISIGFFVHDKINLQNSVDLGAIYAAQRQAEILSAMAHINYQIRQSYKLLAWRYLILGQLGANNYYNDALNRIGRKRLYEINSSPLDNQYHCTNLTQWCSKSHSPSCGKNDIINWTCPYAACFWHDGWYVNERITGDKSHVCQRMSGGGLASLKQPKTTGQIGLPGLTIGFGNIKHMLQATRKTINTSCDYLGYLNWIILTSMYYQFRMDNTRRRVLILDLYNDVLTQGFDITGKKIDEGVQKTIENNLTFINYKNFNSKNMFLEVYSPSSFTDIFEWKIIDPLLLYIESWKPGGNSGTKEDKICPSQVKWIGSDSIKNHTHIKCNGSEKILCDMARWPVEDNQAVVSNNSDSPITLVAGFFRKKKLLPRGYPVLNSQIFYVQVRVEIPSYKSQIFFPFKNNANPVSLKAKAYAKPFGASFGPNEDIDKLLPKGPNWNNNITDLEIFNRIPNYSRYPEDQVGLLSRKEQWEWAKIFHHLLNDRSKQLSYCNGSPCPSFDNRGISPASKGMSFHNYQSGYNFGDPIVQATHHSYYTFLPEDFFTAPIRVMEEIAIAPDLFDLTYYTILPNYMTTFYPKMLRNQKLLSKYKLMNGLLPGDLGHPAYLLTTDLSGLNIHNPPQPACYGSPTSPPFRFNYIEKQINCSRDWPKTSPSPLNDVLAYKAKNINHVLTSWAPPMMNGGDPAKGRNHAGYDMSVNYNNKNPFAECKQRDYYLGNSIELVDDLLKNGKPAEQKLLPYHCLQGGRSGFSVKLFSPSV